MNSTTFSANLPEHRAVISGIGQSAIGRQIERSGFQLTLDAVLAAIADAGLQISDIDGLAMFPGGSMANVPGYSGANLYEVQDALGITTSFRQGQVEGASLPFYGPALAIAAGQARHVVIFPTGDRNRLRPGADPRAWQPARIDFVSNRDTQPHARFRGAVHARKALVEHRLGNPCREQRAFFRRLVQQIIGPDNVLKRQVRMAICHARHQEATARFDHNAPLAGCAAGFAGNGGYSSVVNDHITFVWSTALGVENLGTDDDRL